MKIIYFATIAPLSDKNNRHTTHTVSRSAIIFQAENAAPVDLLNFEVMRWIYKSPFVVSSFHGLLTSGVLLIVGGHNLHREYLATSLFCLVLCSDSLLFIVPHNVLLCSLQPPTNCTFLPATHMTLGRTFHINLPMRIPRFDLSRSFDVTRGFFDGAIDCRGRGTSGAFPHYVRNIVKRS